MIGYKFVFVSLLFKLVCQGAPLRNLFNLDGRTTFSPTTNSDGTLESTLLPISLSSEVISARSFNDETLYAYIYEDEAMSPVIKIGNSKNEVNPADILAECRWKDSTVEHGWSYIWSSFEEGKHDPALQIYAAGILEGILSSRRIKQFLRLSNFSQATNKECILLYVHEKTLELTIDAGILSSQPTTLHKKQTIEDIGILPANKIESSIMKTHIQYLLYQLYGLRDGYNEISDNEIMIDDLIALNLDGDIDELEQLLECKCSRMNLLAGSIINPKYEYDSTYERINQAISDDDYTPKAFVGYDPPTLKSDKTFNDAYLRYCPWESKEPNTETTDEQYARRIARTRCSFLVKALWKKKLNNSQILQLDDIITGHTTWSSFSEMVRILKEYSFPLYLSAKTVRFSSYPGCVSSTDDFIQTSNKLAITETTLMNNSNDNQNYCPIYMGDKLQADPNCTNKNAICWADVLARDPRPFQFMNIITASRLAKSGKEWARIFSNIAVPTYSTHWGIVDYNLIKKNVERLQKWTLTTVEITQNYNVLHSITQGNTPIAPSPIKDLRIPSFSIQDETDSLYYKSIGPLNGDNKDAPYIKKITSGKTYWYSANQPWYSCSRRNLAFPVTYFETPLTEKQMTDAKVVIPTNVKPLISQNSYPRAKLFDLFSPLVESIEEASGLISRVEPNIDAKCDPLFSNPEFAISARNMESMSGGIDSKIVNIDDMSKLIIRAKSGPGHANYCRDENSTSIPVKASTTLFGQMKYTNSNDNNAETTTRNVRTGVVNQGTFTVQPEGATSCEPIESKMNIPELRNIDLSNFKWVLFNQRGDQTPSVWRAISQSDIVLATCNVSP